MAERQPQQVVVHPSQVKGQPGGLTATQILAVVTLLPVGGTLLALAGLTLAGSVIGLLVTTPLFIIFSPVLVPATIVVGLAVTAFLASGMFGLTGLSSLSWVLSCIRQKAPQQLEQAKRRMHEAAATAQHRG
ncbi:oleosin S2-2-like [Carica papaya]|uniref:oleosin S2-2-like n=1 Tax=Carica papaya TaxID=3649 RepID=UPI000B8C7B0C|nr:oleosin S2-2-like [Carica papaya]